MPLKSGTASYAGAREKVRRRFKASYNLFDAGEGTSAGLTHQFHAIAFEENWLTGLDFRANSSDTSPPASSPTLLSCGTVHRRGQCQPCSTRSSAKKTRRRTAHGNQRRRFKACYVTVSEVIKLSGDERATEKSQS
jgi:hypothetical protein